ncbi:hypothetical protein FACS189494_00590 [Spirochaetia bacterium]|nr:hypothetical protein FACS189494_00590 [Spirochaetia bacterium]
MYLAKFNKSSGSIAAAANTGFAASIAGGMPGGVTRIERADIQEFNTHLFPAPAADSGRGVMRNMIARQHSAVNDPKTFWTDEGGWQEVSATLRAQGTHCNIWIDDARYDAGSGSGSGPNNNGKINTNQAEAIAAKFDEIYTLETKVIGFEYGGSNAGIYAGQPAGGVDNDSRIQIFLYDIGNDYESTKNTNSGVLGFFWSKDEMSQTTLDNTYGIGAYKTNLAEMFYIDVDFADRLPSVAYSTLAHEFQHMINYNIKTIINNKVSSTWYNEMLAMAAEDMIGPMIGVLLDNPNNVVNARVGFFLTNYYSASPTQWMSGNNVYVSYSNAYFFSAYLTRNFGGAPLLKAIMENSSVDTDSIGAALDTAVNPYQSTVNTFDKALARYMEALVFSSTSLPPNRFTFHKNAQNTIDGTEYLFTGFDLWQTPNRLAGQGGVPAGYLGPLVWQADQRYPVQSGAVALHSSSSWQNKTGQLSITVTKPQDPNIELYLLVR